MKFNTVTPLKHSRIKGDDSEIAVKVANFSSWRTVEILDFIDNVVRWANAGGYGPHFYQRHMQEAAALHLVIVDSRRDIKPKQLHGRTVIPRQVVSKGNFALHDDVVFIRAQHPDRIHDGIGSLFAQTSDGVEATEKFRQDLALSIGEALCMSRGRRDSIKVPMTPLRGGRKPERKREKAITELRRLAVAKRGAQSAESTARRMFWNGRTAERHCRGMQANQADGNMELPSTPFSQVIHDLTAQVESLGVQLQQERERIRAKVLQIFEEA